MFQVGDKVKLRKGIGQRRDPNDIGWRHYKDDADYDGGVYYVAKVLRSGNVQLSHDPEGKNLVVVHYQSFNKTRKTGSPVWETKTRTVKSSCVWRIV